MNVLCAVILIRVAKSSCAYALAGIVNAEAKANNVLQCKEWADGLMSRKWMGICQSYEYHSQSLHCQGGLIARW